MTLRILLSLVPFVLCGGCGAGTEATGEQRLRPTAPEPETQADSTPQLGAVQPVDIGVPRDVSFLVGTSGRFLRLSDGDSGFWNPETDAIERIDGLRGGQDVDAVATPDLSLLALARWRDDTHEVELWQTREGAVRRFPMPERGLLAASASEVFRLSEQGQIQALTPDGQTRSRGRFRDGFNTSFAVSADGQVFAAGRVNVEVTDGTTSRHFPDTGSLLALSPDGERLALSQEGEVRIVNWRTGAVVFRQDGAISSAAFAASGTLFLVSSQGDDAHALLVEPSGSTRRLPLGESYIRLPRFPSAQETSTGWVAAGRRIARRWRDGVLDPTTVRSVPGGFWRRTSPSTITVLGDYSQVTLDLQRGRVTAIDTERGVVERERAESEAAFLVDATRDGRRQLVVHQPDPLRVPHVFLRDEDGIVLADLGLHTSTDVTGSFLPDDLHLVIPTWDENEDVRSLGVLRSEDGALVAEKPIFNRPGSIQRLVVHDSGRILVSSLTGLRAFQWRDGDLEEEARFDCDTLECLTCWSAAQEDREVLVVIAADDDTSRVLRLAVDGLNVIAEQEMQYFVPGVCRYLTPPGEGRALVGLNDGEWFRVLSL
ncbi:MAG: hypothetical protein AB8H86_25885 [Polyangiales bacterium]